MGIPLGLHASLCIAPDVRKLYPGTPFDVDYESGEFVITLYGNINKKITEVELDKELKNKDN